MPLSPKELDQLIFGPACTGYAQQMRTAPSPMSFTFQVGGSDSPLHASQSSPVGSPDSPYPHAYQSNMTPFKKQFH